MKKSYTLLGFVGLCCLLSSCIFESKNPLSDPAKSKQDFELHGLWVSTDQDGNKSYLHIGAEREHPLAENAQTAEEGLMSFLLITHEAKTGKLSEPFGMRFFVTTLGEDRYATLVLPPETEDKPAPPPTYWFVKYRVTGDKLETWTMDGGRAAEAIDAGRIKGEVTRNPQNRSELKKVLITDTSENLQAVLAEPASANLFPNLSVYTRVR